MPKEVPSFATKDITVYGSEKGTSLAQILRAHFARLGDGKYTAILAYLEQTPAHEAPIQAMRLKLRDKKRVATCAEFGPRFLHSTGQAYKGGPATGVFLVITAHHADDLSIPGRTASFGTVEMAQATGDAAVLAERGRPVLRVHLHDIDKGLAELATAMDEALA